MMRKKRPGLWEGFLAASCFRTLCIQMQSLSIKGARIPHLQATIRIPRCWQHQRLHLKMEVEKPTTYSSSYSSLMFVHSLQRPHEPPLNSDAQQVALPSSRFICKWNSQEKYRGWSCLGLFYIELVPRCVGRGCLLPSYPLLMALRVRTPKSLWTAYSHHRHIFAEHT